MSSKGRRLGASRRVASATLPASFKPGRGQVAVFRAQADGVCVRCERPVVSGCDYVAVIEHPRGGLGLQTKQIYVHALPCAKIAGLEIPEAALEAGIPAAGTAPTPTPHEEPRTRGPRGGQFKVEQRAGEVRTMLAQRASTCPACANPIARGTDIICLWRAPAPEISPSGRDVWIHARCAFERGLRVPAEVKSYLSNQGAVVDGATYRAGRKPTYRRGAGPGTLGGTKY